ncbi:MAG: hypothetical protein ACXIUP_00640 [Microcella sp.]
MRSRRPPRRRPVRWGWLITGVVALALGGLVAWVALPILLHEPQGSSGQARVDGFPTTVTATGDDGLTRTLSAATESGGAVDLAAIAEGDRIVVTGSGYVPNRGIYVAICAIPAQLDGRPGPCLGGVPEQTEDELDEGSVQWAPSNWINNEFAWRIVGARAFDDRDSGSFTAYLLVGPPSDDAVDCAVVECGIYTRNDHTATADRVQDLYLPVEWAAGD